MRSLAEPDTGSKIELPHGAKENWLQQFDVAGAEDVKSFAGACTASAHYLYSADGWQISSAEKAGGSATITSSLS
jgi:hypothetical protein